MQKIKYLPAFSAVALLIISLITSCKKEYVKTPFKNIEQFTVADSLGNKVIAAIVGDTIQAYWAPFQTVPQSVITQITLASGAAVNPASGAKVLFKTGTVFTVTAQDGSTQKYYLKALLNNPAPDFTINSATSNFALGGLLILSGQYFDADTSKIKTYLVSSKNVSYPMSYHYSVPPSTTQLRLSIPFVDTGYYKVKVVSNGSTVIKDPIHLVIPTTLALTSPDQGKTVKRGESLTLNYPAGAEKYFNYVGGKATISTGGGSFTVSPFNVPSTGTIKILIPATAPLANISRIVVYNALGVSISTFTPATGTTVTIGQ